MTTQVSDLQSAHEAAQVNTAQARIALAATIANKDTLRPVYFAGVLEERARNLLNMLDAENTAFEQFMEATRIMIPAASPEPPVAIGPFVDSPKDVADGIAYGVALPATG